MYRGALFFVCVHDRGVFGDEKNCEKEQYLAHRYKYTELGASVHFEKFHQFLKCFRQIDIPVKVK